MTTGPNPRHNASFLVYGKAKVGKSSLAATAPGAKLALDSEGSWNAFDGRDNPNRPGEKYRVTYWDDLSQPPPDMTDADICVVDVLKWETINQVINWVVRTDHPFQSIIMDSVTETQNRCKKSLFSNPVGLQHRDWGELLAHMSSRIKRFRDIIKDVSNPARCMVFTSEGKARQDGTYTPQMEGQLRDSIGYWMNTTAFLKIAQVANSDGIITDDSPVVRRLLVKPHPAYITGSHFEDRFESNAINNPNLTDMMGTIFPGFTTE